MPEVADDAAVGARIRTARTAQALTLRDLARRIGVGHSTLSDIETGQRSLRVTELMQISAVLGMSPEEILTSGEISAAVAARAAVAAAETAGAAVAAWLLAVDRAVTAVRGAPPATTEAFMPAFREVAVVNVDAVAHCGLELYRQVGVVPLPPTAG